MDSARAAKQLSPEFFDLPEKARDTVYRLLLVSSHPLYLFQDNPSQIELFAPEKPTQWTAALRVNRRMSREASAVAYGENKFYFVDATRDQYSLLQAFLTSIGSANAHRLTHICMSFPNVDFHLGEVRLGQDDLQSLTLLREKCANLKTLEAHMQRRSSRDLDWTDESAVQPMRDVSNAYNSELRTLPALESVIVRVHGGKPKTPVMKFMRDLGWIVLPAIKDSWL